MLTLELDKQTENRFSKLLSIHRNDYGALINSMVEYRKNELKKGIRKIESETAAYEKKYGFVTDEFYEKYQNGIYGEQMHDNDFMIWCALHESWLKFQNELTQLQ